jgi:heterodisulfide reductase subunit C
MSEGESAPEAEGTEAAAAPEPSGPDIRPSGEFLKEVEQATGQSLSACFQCRKCTCGCPLNDETDIQPNRLLRLIQFGQRDEVLRSRAIWLCIGCETCTARCPNGVDLAAVMDYLRLTAIREGVEPADPKVAAFHKAFLATVRKYGRSHEVDMIRRYKFKTGTFFENMGMGMEMFKKGKIKIIGRKIEDLQAFREMMDEHKAEKP